MDDVRTFTSAVAKIDALVLVFGMPASFIAASALLVPLSRFARRTGLYLVAHVIAILSCVAILLLLVSGMTTIDSYLVYLFTGQRLECNLPGWSMYFFPALGVIAAAIGNKRTEARRVLTGT